MENLKKRYVKACLPLIKDQSLIESHWLEIETQYSHKSRHYHHLKHLENMFAELETVKDSIQNFSDLSFSVFYHDIIYDTSSKVNEEKSAELAKDRLNQLSVSNESIERIFQQIIATKAHQKSDDHDTNYLLDADLSVLGKDKAVYLHYTQKIRKEYTIYPNFLYKPGRKKDLQHFLQLETIFKTEYFQKQYEEQARRNIKMEINLL